MNTLRCGIALVGMMMVASACGDATGPPNQLSAGERASLAAAMMARAATSVGGPVSMNPGADLIRRGDSDFTFTFGGNDVCTPSGTVSLAGSAHTTFVTATQDGALEASVTIVHSACAFAAESGPPIVVTGAPSLVGSLSGTSHAGHVATLTVHLSGAFDWTRGEGASGHCAVDVTGVRNAATGLVDLSGDFCGFAVRG